VTIVTLSSVQVVTGAMNIRPTMKFVFVTVVMHFIVRGVMRWINVRIVGRLFVVGVALFVVVSFVGVGCVRIVLLLVEGTCHCFFESVVLYIYVYSTCYHVMRLQNYYISKMENLSQIHSMHIKYVYI